MKMESSDLEIEVLVRRIEALELDLQPDFQRGEVWSDKKRQRLIDTILRGWHIPPIHVVEAIGSGKEEVLDGQQRLAAIRDFVRGHFRIDGNLPPGDDAIRALDGLQFADLPTDVKRRFNRYAIRQFRLANYKPEEPAEIFFRLNQPTSLTTAEQRNAFYGNARAEVKRLVGIALSLGVDAKSIGFSNARMSYDDVLARLCLASERLTIRRKIAASDLTTIYRSPDGFSEAAVRRVEIALEDLSLALPKVGEIQRLNKATLFSWLWYLIAARHRKVDVGVPDEVAGLIHLVESVRSIARLAVQEENLAPARGVIALIAVYDDRATSRVSDVSSVVARDLVLWTITSTRRTFLNTAENSSWTEKLLELHKQVEENPSTAAGIIEQFSVDQSWGDL